MLESELSTINITQYMYDNRDNVPLLDTIKITDFVYGRLDIILNRYYRGRLDYIQLFYDFNKITDPTQLNIGRIIDIPDFDNLLQIMSSNNIFSDDETVSKKIPGVNESMNSSQVNIENTKINNKTFTTALPKLNITLKKVSYNAETGELRY